MRFHFISGLPRSGSTLLASLLCQNKRFYSHIESPVGRMVTALHTAMGIQNEAEQFISDAARLRTLRAVFSAFYAEINAKVVFDNNRRWTNNVGLLLQLFPEARIICCVRHPAHIVDSLERLLQRHPLALSAIIGAEANRTVYSRTAAYLAADGVVGFALQALRTAWYGEHRDRCILVRYDDLARFPNETMADLHTLLGEPTFEYDFGAVKSLPGTADFDRRIGTPGLHDLKPTVVYEKRTAVLPPELFNTLPKPFWEPVKEEATKAE